MSELPIPPHFDPSRVGEVWRVPYEERARDASAWTDEHGISPAAEDGFRICLLAVDVQNTFCIPEYELFIAGREIPMENRQTRLFHKYDGRPKGTKRQS